MDWNSFMWGVAASGGFGGGRGAAPGYDEDGFESMTIAAYSIAWVASTGYLWFSDPERTFFVAVMLGLVVAIPFAFVLALVFFLIEFCLPLIFSGDEDGKTDATLEENVTETIEVPEEGVDVHIRVVPRGEK